MKTLCLSIINSQAPQKRFYIPSGEGFKVGFRSENTRINALKKIAKTIKQKDFIQSFVVEEYEGKYESYNNNELVCSYTKDDLSDYGIEI